MQCQYDSPDEELTEVNCTEVVNEEKRNQVFVEEFLFSLWHEGLVELVS